MATRMGLKRLTAEYKGMLANPTPYILARPTEEDILQWYYLVTGPPGTPFEGGQYFGALKFPPNYPYGAPNIRMLTPSGRLTPDTSLCLSMSDFHPESWNPAWNVSTILTGLLSFMTSDEIATGAMVSTDIKKKQLAAQSVKWNLNNDLFKTIFSDVYEEIVKEVPNFNMATSIEVIPPKPADLAAHVYTSQYKAAATIANASADSFLASSPDKNLNSSNQGEFASQGGVIIVVIAVVVVLLSYFIYK